jgi:Rrf2 family iron-sulfur cluster assembly transcriptional regulator
MRLTTKGRYGVRAVVNLAAKEQNRPIPISLIAKEEELSPEFSEQIFFKLKKAGLIRSIRGPKGGFVLNENPSEITIKTILDAVGEPLYPAPCTNPHATPCPRKADCPLNPVWQNFYEIIVKHLSNISLRDIIEKHRNSIFP